MHNAIYFIETNKTDKKKAVLSLQTDCIFLVCHKIKSIYNFIFLLFIFVLMVKMFFMTIELSTLENKVKDLTQELALEEKERRDEQKKLLEETDAKKDTKAE